MKGYVISRFNNSTMPACLCLLEEFKNRNIDIMNVGIEGVYEFENKIYYEGIELENKDFIMLRTKDGLLTKKICLSKTNNCVNDFNIVEKLGNKINQLDIIKNSKSIIIPNYIISTLGISFEFLSDNLNLPFIIKIADSFQGKGVFLIKTKKDYINICNKYSKDVHFVFQEFISESTGIDLRVFILGEEPLFCVKRISNEDFRANYCLGGSIQNFEITDEIRRIAKEVSKLTNLDYCGLDLLFSNDGFAFCELNVNPWFDKYFEEITNTKITSSIVDYTINKK